MPKDYHFGLTAASADTADSFEVNKFLLFTDPSAPKRETAQQTPSSNQGNTPRDTQASAYKSSDAQFEDLHNRLLSLANAVDSLASEVVKLADSSSSRHSELIRVSSGDKLASLDQKISGIEDTLRGFESRFSYLQTSLRDSHSNLVESLPRHMTDGKGWLARIPFSTSQEKLISERSNHDQRTSHGSTDFCVCGCSNCPRRSVPGIQAEDQTGAKEVSVTECKNCDAASCQRSDCMILLLIAQSFLRLSITPFLIC